MMTSLREQKKRQTRKEIVAAAVRLFSQKGFKQTSIEALAREAGVGKGTIYSYFRNKTEIFYAFCEGQLEFIHEQLAKLTDPDAPLIEQLMTVFMGEFAYVTKNKNFGRLFMQEVLFPKDPSNKDFQEIDKQWIDLLFSIFQRAQARNELRKEVDLLFITGHFYALFVMSVSAWYSGRVEYDEVGPGMRQLFQNALDGLAP
jgi:AcrR family transcriptional regulator